MTDYTKTTNFTAKDTAPITSTSKILRGSEFDVEFNAVATAISSKFDSASTVDINGGTIDGTTIGSSSPASGTFSSLTATTVDINDGNIDNTVIGATTPAAATFTAATFNTVTASSDVTVNTNVFKVDTTNNKVGIGTASPSDTLEVAKAPAMGIGNASVTINSDGLATMADSVYVKFQSNSSDQGIVGYRMTQILGSGTGINALSGSAFLDGPTVAFLTSSSDIVNPDVQVDSNGNLKVLTADLICSNDLTVDTDTFYVDATNDRVGVHTTAPSYDLHIKSVSTTSNPTLAIESTKSASDSKNPQLKFIGGVSDATIRTGEGPTGGFKLINDNAGSIDLRNSGQIIFKNDDDGTENTMTLKDNTLNIANIPTSSAGLSSGDIWNDSGTLKIVT